MFGKSRLGSAVLCAALAFGVLAPASAHAVDVYVAQSAAGGNNGADCADARAVGSLTSADWTAGNTIHLCGTITSAISAQGSGTSSSPITLLFDSATKGQIAMPAIPNSGVLLLNNYNYITVDGGGTGIIQSTNNGSPASICPGSPYTNDVNNSTAIDVRSSTGITIKGLTIGPLYYHVCTADDGAVNSGLDAPGPVGIHYDAAANLTVDHTTMHDLGWALWGYGNNITVSNDTFYNFDHGLAVGEVTNAGVSNGIYFFGNHAYNASVWDTNDNSFHHDGIHLYAYCSDGNSFCSGTYITNVYIYNNVFDGTWGNNVNSPVFFENNIQTAYVFNNYFNGSQMVHWGVGILEDLGANVYTYNNTILGYSTNDGNPAAFKFGGPTAVVKNNVVSTANSLVTDSGTWVDGSADTLTLSNNIYANGGSNAFVYCPPSGGSCSYLGSGSYSTWASDTGETAGSYSSSANLSSTGIPQSGSPAIQAGANLTSVCSGQPNPGLGALCFDAAGNPRPTTGPWDAGAYNSTSSTALTPGVPTNLTAVVQ